MFTYINFIKRLLPILLGFAIVGSLFIGSTVTSFAAAPEGTVAVEITTDDLANMFALGHLKVTFVADAEHLYEGFTVDVIDGTTTTNVGSFYSAAADSAINYTFNGVDLIMMYKTEVIHFDGSSVDDDGSNIYDGGYYWITVELPFVGYYDNSEVQAMWFQQPSSSSDDYLIYDTAANYTVYGNGYDDRILTGQAQVVNTPGTWSGYGAMGLDSFYTAGGFSFSKTSRIDQGSTIFSLDSNSELSCYVWLEPFADVVYEDTYSYKIPLCFAMSGFTMYVPDDGTGGDTGDTGGDIGGDTDEPTYAEKVEQYLDAISTPTAEGKAEADRIKNELEEAGANLEQSGDDLQVEVPDVQNKVDELPQEVIDGFGDVVENIVNPLFAVSHVTMLLTAVFVIVTLKLILFGSGPH